MPVQTVAKDTTVTGKTGQFIKGLSYSGPAALVRVASDAREGKQVYADRDYRFETLPGVLRGSDYVQAANADKQYMAVDLMELAVKVSAVVSVAHDGRLPRPAWLLRQFKPTGLRVTVNGVPMTIFQYQAAAGESLTLGSNSDTGKVKSCNMYVVFVSTKPGTYAERHGL